MSKALSLANPSLTALPLPITSGPQWLESLRRDGKTQFDRQGIPATKQEDWRFTNLIALAETRFAEPSSATLDSAKALLETVPELENADGRIVLLNGKVSPELSDMPKSLPPGAHFWSLAEAIAEKPDLLEEKLGSLVPLSDDPFSSLNTALMEDGYVLWLDPSVSLEKPLHIIFVNSANAPIALHPRCLILAGAGSQANIFESYIGVEGDVYFSNPVLEIFLGESAQIGHYRLQKESKEAFHIARLEAKLEANAHLDNFILSLGSRIARNNLYGTLAGSGADLRMNGAYLGRGNQHLDTTSVITHAVGNTTSEETYKGVMDDMAQGVFQGKIAVARDAQKIEGNQLNRGLLLSDRSGIITKPELEIFADDVKCSHGATIGELNPEALFYLRARGIDRKIAERMLVEAFVADVITSIALEEVHPILLAEISDWMEKGGGA